MRKVLLTGMSGTGKSTALVALEKRGFAVVDTDHGGWSEWSDADGGYVWREDRIAELLAREEGPTLYVSATVSNQGRFYPQFDAVVLLSAPAEVLLHRIATRATNDYGKSDEDRALILQHLAEVEALLRATCTHEVDAAQPIDVVVQQLVAIGEDAVAGGGTRRIGSGAMEVSPADVLEAHVRRFNEGVRSGDFTEMVRSFTADAEMVFEGVPVGPFVGRDAIAEAYSRQPPDDEVRLLGVPRAHGECVESDYAWAADGRRAGRMIITARDGAIAQLIVTFE